MKAIGGLDRAGRLDQLKTFARVQVWSGYKSPATVRAEVYDALLDEVKEPGEASSLTTEYLQQAYDDLVEAASSWPAVTDFDRLQAAIQDLRDEGLVVLEACDDHWAANDALGRAAESGQPPTGIAFFTHADVWHAVEHGMLELNVWHPSSANVAPGDDLLALVESTLVHHGLAGHFDEGRIEVTVAWERRPGESFEAE